jgi:hypothetical protein
LSFAGDASPKHRSLHGTLAQIVGWIVWVGC